MNQTELLEKYDVPAPRYTSYPTVPYWSDNPTTDQWIDSLKSAAQSTSGWSMYVHIPYCETLCTFCGCNTSITKNHKKELPYVEKVLKEWEIYTGLVPELAKRPLKELHLGGGTPTFLSPENLVLLVQTIMNQADVDLNDFAGSLEVDPRRTTTQQLQALYNVGFRRVSMGVQDFDPEVQRLINRVQPFEMTKNLTQASRDMGYQSVNFDLIYGLPNQTLESTRKMAELTVDLKPDRIALYSMALVPWIKPAQRLFKDEDLPVGADKRALYELAREILLSSGYFEIGMDHFALESDSLYQAYGKGELHRNFMGYTDKRTDILLGLGVSAISESPTCFHQNEKVLNVYERYVEDFKVPTFRGHRLSDEDQRQRELILKFMTQLNVKFEDDQQKQDVKSFLNELVEDGLVEFSGQSMKLTDKGRPFLRNACMALDLRLRRQKPETKVFSQAM